MHRMGRRALFSFSPAVGIVFPPFPRSAGIDDPRRSAAVLDNLVMFLPSPPAYAGPGSLLASVSRIFFSPFPRDDQTHVETVPDGPPFFSFRFTCPKSFLFLPAVAEGSHFSTRMPRSSISAHRPFPPSLSCGRRCGSCRSFPPPFFPRSRLSATRSFFAVRFGVGLPPPFFFFFSY